MLAKILVSACLTGSPVRYDGSARTLEHDLLDGWRRERRLVTICPEIAGGMSTPRPAAEIVTGKSGADVLAGAARVVDADGGDLTASYIGGAVVALELAIANGCRFALLTDGSPSCGSGFIHDGRFAGARVRGIGVTAALLLANGIEVFAPADIEVLAARLRTCDARSRVPSRAASCFIATEAKNQPGE